MPKRFHLAWFTNFTAGAWDATFSHGGSPWDGKFYIEMAQALERACFDYVIYEDKLLVPEAYRGLERFAARKRIVADLEAAGLVEKIEPHAYKVPYGDRSQVVIEPWLTDQWYCDAKTLAAEPIAASGTGSCFGTWCAYFSVVSVEPR